MIRMPTFAAAALIALTATAQAADVKAGALTIEAPWARASAGPAAGAFLTIRNDGDADRLVAVSSDAAQKTEMHTSFKEGDVMKMRLVEALDVPAHGSVALQPGGNHIMLMGLKNPLKAGDTLPLTLRFEKAGAVQVEASVESAGAMHGPMGGMGAMPDHQHMMQGPKQ